MDYLGAGSVAQPEPNAGPTYTVFGQSIAERITCDQYSGNSYVFDEITPPGMGVPPHRHTLEDEIVLIHAGVFEVFMNGSVHRAGKGTILNFARGSLHGFKCVGDIAGHSTWVVTPGSSMQAFMRALAKTPPGPPDFKALDLLHAKHGMTMLQPTEPWW